MEVHSSESLIAAVVASIDDTSLSRIYEDLRRLDAQLDDKMSEIQDIRKDVSIWDRVNIFSRTDTQRELAEQIPEFKQVRREHLDAINRLKSLINSAMQRDFGISLKVHTGVLYKAISSLRVRPGTVKIDGMDKVNAAHQQLARLIDNHFGFPYTVADGDQLQKLVYDELLKNGGFKR